MNVIERAGLKGFGWRLRRMDKIKRWLPLLGTALLAVTVALRAFGQPEAAQAIESIGGLVGLTSAPSVSYAELAAAGAALAGVVLKIASAIKTAKAGPVIVTSGVEVIVPSGQYAKGELDTAVAEAASKAADWGMQVLATAPRPATR